MAKLFHLLSQIVAFTLVSIPLIALITIVGYVIYDNFIDLLIVIGFFILLLSIMLVFGWAAGTVERTIKKKFGIEDSKPKEFIN